MRHNYNWIWKWHLIGGLVSMPVILILSITGIIYLFKDNYEKPLYEKLKRVEVTENRISFQEQWKLAKENWEKTPTSLTVSSTLNEATQFVSGKFSHKSSLFIDPFSGKVTGKITLQSTDMHKVRKLHGELLTGSFGTKIIELVGSWMVVLIFSGLYLFWPRERGIKGIFIARRNVSRRVFFRDLHGIVGFWFSLVILLILAGGMPWTDVFGGGFKWIAKKTETGFPPTWNGHSFVSEINGEPISLDEMVLKAKKLDLSGVVSIHLPQSDSGIYSVSNEVSTLWDKRMIHFDQYSGQELYSHTGKDIGILMKIRLWTMAFHQGQFGTWNVLLVLITALGLLVLSTLAICSYFLRKKKGSWSIPSTSFPKVNKVLIFGICIIGVLLPLFGFSIVIIYLIDRFLGCKNKFLSKNNI